MQVSGPVSGHPALVTVQLLRLFVPFLRFKGHGGDWPCLQSPQADGLAGLFAIAVLIGFDPGDGLIDLVDQLSRPVPRPEFQRVIGLHRCALDSLGGRQRLFL